MAVYGVLSVILYAVRQHRALRNDEACSYAPLAAVIIPVKGLSAICPGIVSAYASQRYPAYDLVFVVESAEDPAYAALQAWLQPAAGACTGPVPRAVGGRPAGLRRVEIVVAGPARDGGQKVHNLLAGVGQVAATVEVLVFADADVAVPDIWLARLVAPLQARQVGLSSTGRWLVPHGASIASCVAAAAHASINTQGGCRAWNLAWGGSMALRVETLRAIDLVGRLHGALNDDLQLTCAVRAHRLHVHYVHGLATSCAAPLSWRSLFEFGRRQYVQVRLYGPYWAWWVAALQTATYCAGLSTALLQQWGRCRAEALTALVIVGLLDGVRGMIRVYVVHDLFPATSGVRRWPYALMECLGTPLWVFVHGLTVWSTAVHRRVTWCGVEYAIDGRQSVRIVARS